MARILVVDDDEIMRWMITDYLRRKGHDCIPAENVSEACRHLHKKSFELTISDFNMPAQTGLDLLRYVSLNSPSTSFILISAEIDSCLREKALELGAIACMIKPFKLQELLTKVESALQAHSRVHLATNHLRRLPEKRVPAVGGKQGQAQRDTADFNTRHGDLRQPADSSNGGE
jgi:DNA-binding NtrC family response regulator